MRAAVFEGPDRPLAVREVPTPEPGPGEVLVRVAGCGICHTDLHYLDHGVPTFKPPPLILGHEAAGHVAAVGEGVEGWGEGDAVLLPAVVACGRCRFCREGRENLCDDLRMFGNNVDGAYAEFVVAPAKDLFRLPDSLEPRQASVIADAVSTPYHAVKYRARVRPGETVVVVGCGGIGLNLVQCAALAGAAVVAVDRIGERLEVARSLGAAETLNAAEVERVDKAVRSLTGGGADVAFEAVGAPGTLRTALACLRRGGRLCAVGYSAEEVPLSAARIMYHELEIVGSLGCRGVDYPDVIDLVARGRLRLDAIVSGYVPLEEVNAGLDRLRAGEGIRWVVVPAG